jgi:hypothetical protein
MLILSISERAQLCRANISSVSTLALLSAMPAVRQIVPNPDVKDFSCVCWFSDEAFVCCAV